MVLRQLLRVSALFLVTTAYAGAAEPGERRVIGYFAEWRRTYRAADVPAEMITHLNYAFAVIHDGKCSTKDAAAAEKHFAELRQLKQKHPHLKTLISVGGWTDSGPFSDTALTEASRDTFARSAATFASEHGFDGVDIDWEYPGGGGMEKEKARPEDTRNFTLLLQALRRHLDEQGEREGKRYLLTIAAPAGAQHRRMELEQIHPLLDFINLMTYDFAGYWAPHTGFNAPLFADPARKNAPNADAAVRAYLARGVPKEKLCLGVPFYGRAFGGVKNVNRGLYQPHTGKAERAIGSGEDWSYRSIAEHYVGKLGQRHWHEHAQVPWLYDADKQLFISYDDPESIGLKAQYVRKHDLGGVMIWELSHDDAKSSLLTALMEGLAPAARQLPQDDHRPAR